MAALELFARRLQGYWHGILARYRHSLKTSVVEGVNNTIKVIKRRAYGYRDEEYLSLKIHRAAFPLILDEPEAVLYQLVSYDDLTSQVAVAFQ